MNPVTFCPNSLVWGDLATWVSGIATLIVGFLAWQASSRAVRISHEATRIAKQQLDEGMRERVETARIIGRLLHSEITTLPVRANRALTALERAINWSYGNQIINESAIQFTLETCIQPMLPSAERVEERIHTLPDSLGADLAALIGHIHTTQDIASLIAKKIEVIQFPVRKLHYSGHHDHFDSFLKQLFALTSMSMGFATEFQQFVGVPPQSYPTVLASLEAIKAAHPIDWPSSESAL